MSEAYIIDAVRSPIGKRHGSLAQEHPVDLLARILWCVVDRTGIDPGLIDDHITGCVGQVGPQAYNVARWAWLAAGLPAHVPSMTIDRQCGSSQQAIHNAAMAVMSGQQDVVIASGVEVMSRVPLGAGIATLSPKTLKKLHALPVIGRKLRALPLATGNPFTSELLRERYPNLVQQGFSAGAIADTWGITREAMDRYALHSHERAIIADERGLYESQIIPVAGLLRDEGVRAETSMEKLGNLREPFEEGSGITAGNASQISDGAAAVMIASKSAVGRYGLVPRAKIVSLAVVGSDPILMLTGPIAATRKVLKLEYVHLHLSNIDLVEINEAFASVVLAWKKELHIDDAWFEANVNPNGGAIAHGHPLGATGAILMTKMLYELERREGQYGLQVMCEGGGMANATVIERM